jgi:membrane protease YdiL (CAAX protease family)
LGQRGLSKFNKPAFKDATLVGGAMIIFFGVQNLMALGYAYLPWEADLSEVGGLLQEMSYYLCGIFLAILFLRRRDSDVMLRRTSKDNARMAVLVFAGGYIVVIGLNLLFYYLTDAVGLQSYDIQDTPPASAGGRILRLIEVSVIAPVFEEILFRGLILGRLRKYGNGFAIIISSLLFACAHSTLYGIPGIFFLAVLFAYVDIKCDSIYPSMVFHFINNFYATIVSYYQDNIPVYLAIASIMGIVFSGCMVAFVFLIIKAENYKKRTKSPLLKGKLRGPYGAVFASPTILIYLIYSVFSLVYTTLAASGLR